MMLTKKDKKVIKKLAKELCSDQSIIEKLGCELDQDKVEYLLTVLYINDIEVTSDNLLSVAEMLFE